MKTVLVVGASSGIGLACVLHLAQRGYRVFAASRSPPPGDTACEYIPMDVTSEASVEHAIGMLVARAGQLDAVVHSAGFGIAGAIEDTSIPEAQQQLDTNFFGVLRVLRAALPHLRAARGRIVLVSSIAGQVALPFQGLYSASKFALEGLGESLAHELHASGVHISLVQPGDFRTAFNDSRKLVRASGPNSPYHPQFERTLAIFIAEEQHGPDPAAVAHVVHRALTAARPRLRYRVGLPLQRASVALKALLPWRLFAWVLRKIYDIRRE